MRETEEEEDNKTIIGKNNRTIKKKRKVGYFLNLSFTLWF